MASSSGFISYFVGMFYQNPEAPVPPGPYQSPVGALVRLICAICAFLTPKSIREHPVLSQA